MVRYIQAVFEEIVKFISNYSFKGGITVFIVFVILGIMGIFLYRIDKEAFEKATEKGKKSFLKLSLWIFVVIIVLLQIKFMVALRQGVINRVQMANSALYTSSREISGGPIVQYGPDLTCEEMKTTTQRIIIPQNTINVINTSGINYMPGWSPQESTVYSDNYTEILDELEKDENAIVIKRTINKKEYKTIKLNSTDIKLKLTFNEQDAKSKKQYYKASFSGRYTFANPLPDRALLRFNFPLPDGCGTLSDCILKVDGKIYPAQDLSNGYEWEAEIEPNKIVQVEVNYNTEGSTSWNYNLSYRKTSVSDFNLQVEADKSIIKFQKGSLYPTSLSRGLSGSILNWNLKNLITSQNISLYFSGISVIEIITRMYIFSSIALTGFIIMLIVWGNISCKAISHIKIIIASSIYSGAYAITAYLITYMPLSLAILIAFLITGFLNSVIMGKNMIIPVIIFSFIPLTFVWVGNTGLILCVTGLITIGIIAFRVNNK